MSDTASDVALVGEAMPLPVADRPGPIEHASVFRQRTAGAETSVAIGLARFGPKGGRAGRRGTDSMGRSLTASMKGEGIDCSHVVCDATQRTGFAADVINALREGRDARDAARRGAWIGARAVQTPGDIERLPTRDELRRTGFRNRRRFPFPHGLRRARQAEGRR